jgi:hypothetical protein
MEYHIIVIGPTEGLLLFLLLAIGIPTVVLRTKSTRGETPPKWKSTMVLLVAMIVSLISLADPITRYFLLEAVFRGIAVGLAATATLAQLLRWRESRSQNKT